jgi:phosphoribosylformimino-5-aminoimidazole carboxamide ribotide isomerase
MIVYPAIDLRGGRVVRLTQGRAEAETVYGDDPAVVARQWAAEGAQWLHVVNLDGAFETGRYVGATLRGRPADPNQALRAILDAVTIPVQFGGGLRSLADVAAVFEMGVARVILGTVAVTQPEVVVEAVQRFGAERVVVGIDARDGRVAIHGWQTTSEVPAIELGQRVRELGVVSAVYTDVARDGTLDGINVEATRRLAEMTGLRIIASGGVASLADVDAVRALEPAGVEGLIVGRALYAGTVCLADVLAVAAGRQSLPLRCTQGKL